EQSSSHYFPDDCGQRVVLEGFVALEVAVEVAAEDCVVRESEAGSSVARLEDGFAQQRRTCDAAVARSVHRFCSSLFRDLLTARGSEFVRACERHPSIPFFIAKNHRRV